MLWFWDKDPTILLTAMLIMTLGDLIASWFGESRSHPISFKVWTDKKSLQGSLAMFGVGFIIEVVGMYYFRRVFHPAISLQVAILFGFFTALFAAVSETVLTRGQIILWYLWEMLSYWIFYTLEALPCNISSCFGCFFRLDLPY